MYMKGCLSCSEESCDFFVAHRVVACKEKNVTSQNVEVADAKGSLSIHSME